MSVFTNKKDADDIVISNLLKEIRRLKMPIVKTTDGKYYRVESDQELTENDVQAHADQVKAELASLESLIAPAESAPEAPVAPEAPAAPEAQPEVAQPSAPETTPAEAPAENPTPVGEPLDGGLAPTDNTPAPADQPDPNSITLQ